MSKQYKVLVNTGKETDNRIFDIPRNAGAKGTPVRIKAKAGNKYQLQEVADQTGEKNVAPDYVKTRRVGKNLLVILEGDKEASLIIEDYYDVFPAGYNGLIGQAENGSFYEYIPEDPNVDGLVPNLRDGGEAINAALGGSEVQAAGAAVGLLVFNPLLAALGAAGVAAAAASGGGTTAAVITPIKTTGALADTSDSGTTGDNKTNNTKPAITGTATPGSTVSVVINDDQGKPVGTYTATATADGNYTVNVPADLVDGTYSPVITVTPAGGSAGNPTNGTPFTIDTVTNVAITDPGTAGTKNTLSGTAEAGDIVTVKDVNSVVLGSTTAGTDGKWSLTPNSAVPAGIVTATAVDPSGNAASTNANLDSATDSKTSITLDPLTGDNIVNASEADQGITTLTGKVAGAFTPGDTVTVYVNDKTYTTTVNADGSYRIPVTTADIKADTDTKVEVAVAAKDPASGSVSTITNAQDYSVETAATNGKTTALAIDPVATDNLINKTESTNGNTPITGKVTGVFSAGDVVTLVVNQVNYTGTVNAQGVYTINVATANLLADKDTQIDGFITTSTGKTNAIQNYGVDTSAPNGGTAPGLKIDTDGNNDGWINRSELNGSSTVKVTATFDPAKVDIGDKIIITPTDGSAPQIVTIDAAAKAAGTVSVTFPTPAEGKTLDITAVIQDASGNKTPEATDSAKVDTSNFGPDAINTDKNIAIVITSDSETGGGNGVLGVSELTGGKINVKVTLSSDAKAGDTLIVEGTGNNAQNITLSAEQVASRTVQTTFDAPANGTKFVATAQLSDLAQNISNKVEDSAVINTNLAGAPGVVITSDKDNNGYLNKAELSGQIEVKITTPADAAVGDKIIVTDGVNTPQEFVLTQTQIDNGITTSFAAPADGSTFNVSATLTASGSNNVSPAGTDSAKLDLTDFSKVDPSNPNGPRISALGVNIDTDAGSNGDGIITAAELASTGNKIKVTIALPAGAAAGDTLTVNASGNKPIVYTLTQADIDAKQYVITDYNSVGDNNTFDVTASIKDAAGNASPTPDAKDSALMRTVIAGAPVVVITEDSNNDTLISKDELNGTVGVNIIIPKEAREGDTLKVTINGTPEDIVLSAQQVTAGNITKEVTAPASGGVITVKAQLIALGNQASAEGSDTATIDTITPNGGNAVEMMIDTDGNNDGWLNRSELVTNGVTRTTVSVTAKFDGTKVDIGDKLVFTLPDGSLKTITIDDAAKTAGKVTLTDVPTPAEGQSMTVKAVIKDAAGNTTPITNLATDTAKVDTSNFGPDTNPANADKNIAIVITSDLENNGAGNGVLSIVELTGNKINVKITFSSDAKAGDTLIVEGTGNNAQNITLSAEQVASRTVQTTFDAPANGTKFVATAQLSDLAQNISNKVEDSAVINTSLPGAPGVVVLEDADKNGYINKGELNGNIDVKITVPAGAVVGDKITVTDGTGTPKTFTLTQADIDNGITTSFPAPTDGAIFKVDATLTPAATGITSAPGTASAKLDLTDFSKVDPSNPSGPRITAVGVNIDTDAVANGDGIITAAELASTGNKIKVTIALPAGAAAGDTLTVNASGNKPIVYTLTQADIDAKQYVITDYNSVGDGQDFVVTASIKDAAGNASPTPDATDKATMRTVIAGAPVVVITEDSDNDTFINKGELSGTVGVNISIPTAAKAGDTLIVTINGVQENIVLTTAQISDQSITKQVTPVEGQTLTVTAQLKDTGGQLSAVGTDSAKIDTTDPVGAISIDAITGDDFLTAGEQAGKATITGKVTGEFRAGDIVTVMVDGTGYTGSVDASGQYSIPGVPGSKLVNDFNTADKAVSATILAHDTAGNTATYTATPRVYTLDSNNDALKTALSLDPVTGDNIITAAEGGVANTTLTGKATGTFAAGDVVTLTVNDQKFSGAVDANGNYSIPVTTADLLADADTKVEARIAATVGTTKQTAVAAQDYVVETGTNAGKITALSIDPVTADNIIVSSESTGTMTITGKVTGTFASTDIVAIMVNGTPYRGTANNGSFSINVPASELLADSDTQIEGIVIGTGGTVANAMQNYAIMLNVPPVNTVPGEQTVAEDTQQAITGLSVADADGNLATSKISVLHGNLNIDLSGGATISAGSNDSATLTLSGTQAQINAALATVKYTGASNYNGADTLSIVSTDSAGVTDTDTVAITVTPVDDFSLIGGTLKGGVNEDETNALPPQGVITVTGAENIIDNALKTPASLEGTYGKFTLNTSTGYWDYTLDNTKASVQALAAGQKVSDKLTVTSKDGTASKDIEVTITGTNDAPVLADTSMSMNGLMGTSTAAPSGAVGNLVSSFMGGVSDVDSDSAKGLAITSVDTTKGALYYSLNGGATWTVVGAVSTTSALLLSSDTDNRLYFKPATGVSSAVTAAFTFRAWDQTTGTEGTKVDTSINGNTTAFSVATDVVSQPIGTTTPAPNPGPSGSWLGESVSMAGDVNGDGFADFIVGAPGGAGSAYVMYGNGSGTVPTVSAGTITAAQGFKITSHYANSCTGDDVTGIGDINGDGLDDVMVGNTSSYGLKSAYVVYGNATGTGATIDGAGNLSAGAGGFRILGDENGYFGYSISGAGDVNGDGYSDMLVGAPEHNSAYLVYGGPANGATLDLSSRTIAPERGFKIDTPNPSDSNSEGDVSGAGDVNGDGLADILVSVSPNGDAYVIYGNTTGAVPSNLSTMTAAQGMKILSSSVLQDASSAGDVNGDGLADLIVNSASYAYVVYGNSTGAPVTLETLNASQGYKISGFSYTRSVSSAGDINGDGLADLIIGNDGKNQYDLRNKTYVVYGNASGTAINVTTMTPGQGFSVEGTDFFGWSASSAGDINGDGMTDLIVGAWNYSGGRGSYSVVFGGTNYMSNVVSGSTNVTGTASGEAIVGSAGDDTLIGGGGVDRFFAGSGNDTIVLSSTDVSNLATNGNNTTTALSTINGGGGFDALRLNTAGVNLDLTAIPNQGAMGIEENSRIESIERIDLGADAVANTLTLNPTDVKDMTAFNNIHTGSVSDDGNTWTNVGGGTALSATTSFHQLVVDGTSSDVVNLKASTTTWFNAGTVNNGTSNYVVWQNTASNSQVLVQSDVAVNVQPITTITQAVTDVGQTDSFTTTTDSGIKTSVSTALWDISSTTGLSWLPAPLASNWVFTGPVVEMHINRPTGLVTDTFKLKGGSSFSGISFETALGNASQASNAPITLNFYDVNNALLATTNYRLDQLPAGISTYKFDFSGQATHFDMITDGRNSYAIDNLAYVTTAGATQASVVSGGTMIDNTPVLNGTISRALAAGETVDIFLDGAATPAGSATIAVGTSAWSWTQPTDLSSGAHTYVAKINSGGSYISSSSAFSLTVAATPLVLDLNGDGVQTVDMAQGVQFDLLATGTKQSVGWVDKHDGLLVMDLNGDGKINSGAELFGDRTRLADGSLAKDGWAALAAQDGNADGVINAQDAAFNALQVWVDANGDGTTDAGELHKLVQLNIHEISLNTSIQHVAQNGNVVGNASAFATTDGQHHDVADVWFKVDTSLVQNKPYTLSPEQLAQANNSTQSTDNGEVKQFKLNVADVLQAPVDAVTGKHVVQIVGDSNDTLNLSNLLGPDAATGHWAATGSVQQDGVTFNTYGYSADPMLQLLVDNHIQTVNLC